MCSHVHNNGMLTEILASSLVFYQIHVFLRAMYDVTITISQGIG